MQYLLYIFILALYLLWGDPQTPTGCSFAISMLAGAAMRQLAPEPENIPPPPVYNPPPTPEATPIDKAPDNSSAVQLQEKRRILAAQPKKTVNEYAGNLDDKAPIVKKTLLGGGTTGSVTTGA
jgi:hypothetical protein